MLNLHIMNLVFIFLRVNQKQLKYIILHQLKGIFHLGSVDMMTQAQFVEELVGNLTNKDVMFQ
ncbi:hypothetical protein AM506_19355 [Rossellomorea vietnamensis]|uniref:Uncharacterized protein n=1 Tax=Rossellomorea vietnamensis TaxID=218284 RepID=A0A0N8GGA8_9BACI|nr:hypothetical protein AM506_19355 [Rossellomorea vietnamensis]